MQRKPKKGKKKRNNERDNKRQQWNLTKGESLPVRLKRLHLFFYFPAIIFRNKRLNANNLLADVHKWTLSSSDVSDEHFFVVVYAIRDEIASQPINHFNCAFKRSKKYVTWFFFGVTTKYKMVSMRQKDFITEIKFEN